MRLISAPPNVILGTWISEAGVSGPDCRTGTCGAPGGMLACGPPACASHADVTPVRPAVSTAPDCRKFLREFGIEATSLGHSFIGSEVVPAYRISWYGSRGHESGFELIPSRRLGSKSRYQAGAGSRCHGKDPRQTAGTSGQSASGPCLGTNHTRSARALTANIGSHCRVAQVPVVRGFARRKAWAVSE